MEKKGCLGFILLTGVLLALFLGPAAMDGFAAGDDPDREKIWLETTVVNFTAKAGASHWEDYRCFRVKNKKDSGRLISYIKKNMANRRTAEGKSRLSEVRSMLDGCNFNSDDILVIMSPFQTDERLARPFHYLHAKDLYFEVLPGDGPRVPTLSLVMLKKPNSTLWNPYILEGEISRPIGVEAVPPRW